MKPRFVRAVAVLAGFAISGPLAAQRRFPPDSFTNLKVLPKSIDQHDARVRDGAGRAMHVLPRRSA